MQHWFSNILKNYWKLIIFDFLGLFLRDWPISREASPWTNPRKKSRSLIFIFTFSTWLFSPLATNMGQYGPVWTRMDPYIIIYCFYMTYTLFLHCCIWFLMVLYMSFDNCWHILKTYFTHVFITFLVFTRIISVVLRPRNSPYNAKLNSQNI